MSEETAEMTTWERLEGMIDGADGLRLERFLRSLPSGDTAHTIARLSDEAQSRLFAQLPAEYAAELVEALSHAQAAEIIEDLPADLAASIVDRMSSDEQTDLLAELDDQDAEAILAEMSPEEVEDVRRLSKYGPDTAGGIMITEYMAFPDTLRVEELIRYLRAHRDEITRKVVQYIYVVDAVTRRFKGVVRMRDAVLAPEREVMGSIMIHEPERVPVGANLDQMQDFFDRHSFNAAPVIDEAGRLVGVIRRAAVEEALGERADKALLRFGGIVAGEELRSMPVLERAARRLMFLCPNIGLNLAAASVIAMFLPVLERVAALMIFLPILSDMSGCSGNQAIAVSMRELSLGVVRPYELMRVLSKELAVGVINGTILGVILFGIAVAMRGDPTLGVVVGVALAVNSLIAVSLGGTVPLMLKGLKVDPALASGPILTTITDIAGFTIALSLATVIMAKVAGG